MILQALCEQYDLLAKTHEELPLYGHSMIPVSFGLCLKNDGDLIDIIDLRNQEKNKFYPATMVVPIHFPREGKGAPAYFLCDNACYALGYDDKLQKILDDPPTEGKKLEDFLKLKKKVDNAFLAFKELHIKFLGSDHPISKFVSQWEPREIKNDPHFISLLKDMKGNTNFVFYLENEDIYAHEKENAIIDLYINSLDSEDQKEGQCLVTGKMDKIARVHNKIKGIDPRSGANPAGCTLVGFQGDSFRSYGKEQSYNAPVCKKAMFQYTTALNYMLANNSYHSQLNDITVVFWANQPGDYGNLLKAIMPDFTDKNEAEEYRNLAKDLIFDLKEGRPLKHREVNFDPHTEVYILGLSPNNARLAIAFWQINTFEFFLRRIDDHYHNLEIIEGYDILPIWRILQETIPLKSKDKKISPVMTKAFALSIFTGGLYPISLYQAIINRIHADGDVKNPVRVAMIKAYLMRKYKIMNYKEVITVSLNESEPNVGYQLGRLFAALEKLQQAALGYDLNSTIKDRYFSSASTSPAAVFPQLLKLSIYHSAKAKSGGYWEKVKADILDKIGNQFPQHLSLDDQGRFILGYYHQTYKKKEED